MPKLPDVKFYETSATDEYAITCPAKVEAHSGKFELTINEELHAQITLLDPPGVWPCLKRPPRNSENVVYTVTSMTMTAARDAVTQAIRSILATEIEEHMIISYCFETTCHWWDNRDGTMSTNGSEDANGAWSRIPKFPSSTFGNPYSLGLYVKVMVKQLHKNARGVVEKEIHLSHSPKFSDRQKYIVAHRLNDFTHMHKGGGMVVKNMPYTDEAAAFFYGLLHNLCATSKRIGEFFADQSAVIHAIENQDSLPLLTMGRDRGES